MHRQFSVVALMAVAACGGGSTIAPAPSDPSATLALFMDAVKRNDLAEMGRLWGSAEGPAAARMGTEELQKRLEVIRIYLDHESYRVIAPAPVTAGGTVRRAYQIELIRRTRCKVAFPLELVQTEKGEWLVQNVNLDQIGNPARACTS